MLFRINYRMLFVFVLLILQTEKLFADDETDSLTNVINKIIEKNKHSLSLSDSIKIEELIAEANSFEKNNADLYVAKLNNALVKAAKQFAYSQTSKILEFLGVYYMMNEQYTDATKYFINALKIEEFRNDKKRIADIHVQFGLLYYYLEMFNLSLQNYELAMPVYKANNDTANIAFVLLKIGKLHLSREYCEQRTEKEKEQDYYTSIQFYNQATQLYQSINRLDGVAKCNHDIGTAYNKLAKSELALTYLKKAENYYLSVKDSLSLTRIYQTFGLTYARLMRNKEAIDCYKKSLEIAYKLNQLGGVQYLFENMAQAYVNLGDYKSAHECYLKYMIIRDSVYNSTKSKQIFELETKYQTAKKESSIQQLQAQKKEHLFWIYSLTGFALLLSTLIFLIYRNQQKNKIIAKQRIADIEKESQLLATTSILKGEEAERTRLAKELHDGIGGLLSVVKMKLMSVKSKAALTENNLQVFSKAVDLLDDSITELRRVSHNLMPESLIKYGLKAALTDYCNSIEIVHFHYFGEEKRLDARAEIAVYRIIQELVNNAIKHANATQINVQLIMELERISITIQDDGKGFDLQTIDESKTNGLTNIRSRIQSFSKGAVDIVSQIGQGTEVHINFNI